MSDKEQPQAVNNGEILARAKATRNEFYSQIFDVANEYRLTSHQPEGARIRTPAPLTRDRGPYADLGRRIRLHNTDSEETSGD